VPAERGGGKGGHGAELKEGAGEEEGGDGGERGEEERADLDVGPRTATAATWSSLQAWASRRVVPLVHLAWERRWSLEMAAVVLTGVYSLVMAELLVRICSAVVGVREHLPVDLGKVSLEAVASYHRDTRLRSWFTPFSLPRIRSDGSCRKSSCQ